MGTPNLSSSSTSTNSDTDKSSDSSLQNSITSVSSEEEDEDPLLFPLMHHLITGRKRHHIENYIQVIDLWTEQEFKEHLRLTRKTALKLIGTEHFKYISELNNL